MLRLRLRVAGIALLCVYLPGSEDQICHAEPREERVLEAARFFGRGGTYVAAYDSDEATRANPATLDENEISFQLRPFELGVFPGVNSLESISDLTSLSGNSTPQTILQKLESKIGKHQYFRGHLIPFAMRILSFEITPFASNYSFLDMRVPSLPEATILADTAFGANFSLGLPLGSNFSLGFTIRPMYRLYLRSAISFAELLDFLDNSNLSLEDKFPLKSGFALGSDLGFIWRMSPTFRLGLVWENIGYAGYVDDPSKPPPPYKQKLSLGSLWRMNFGVWHWDHLFDYQDLLNPYGDPMLRLLKLGTEFGRSWFTRDHDVGIMAGLNEGYIALGAFIDLWIFRIDFAQYGVEIGEIPGQRQDRRWAITGKTSMTF